MMIKNKPVALIILDGWGMRLARRGNAVQAANTPNIDRWLADVESSVVDASGEAVGLTANQMGNSEVGHLNLGAGRIVLQDVSRIDKAIESGEFSDLLLSVGKFDVSSRIHLIGLLGPGGVHAHDRHLYAILKEIKMLDKKAILHIITDGRDTPPKSSLTYLESLSSFIRENEIDASIATVSGRYYTMDRDKRWDRVQKGYDVMVNRKGRIANTPADAIQASYDEEIADEFIIPTVIEGCDNCAIESGDTVFFFNFRADRMRQIVSVFTAPEDIAELSDVDKLQDLNIVTMTTYEKHFPVKTLFPMEILKDTLAEFLSQKGLKQFHTAETEKYPHVTYFFNGRREDTFPGEERALIPSPKVATYDLQPEMSAREVTDLLLERLKTKDDDFILVNYANPDMVGHTGDFEAVTRAIEVVDECVGKFVEAIHESGGVVVVGADHGNAETMVDVLTEEPHTYHTTNPVHFFIVGSDRTYKLFSRGVLADVAPTVIELLGLEKPASMTGKSLIEGESLK